MAEAPRFDPEQLLRHDRLVRELARQLVGDHATAEDIAQQTWVAALTASNAARHSVSGWLAGTVRRIVGKHVRSESVRRRYRSESMLPPPAPATDEIVEREHARAAVVQAVMALPVGYRDVVLLRWFEGLPPREIARQLQLPVETVRTRCRRALDQLRAVLDAEHGGDRSGWVMLLLPLTTPSRAVVAATGTALSTAMIWGGMGTMMKSKLAIAVATTVLLLVAWSVVPLATEPPTSDKQLSEALRVMATVVPDLRDAANAATQRSREPVLDVGTSLPPSTGSLTVLTKWHDGMPASGVSIMVAGANGSRMMRTDAAGTARLVELAAGEALLTMLRSVEMQQRHLRVVAGEDTVVDLIVPTAMTVTGIVVDGNGEPIVDAAIRTRPRGSGMAFEVARTGSDGRFEARDIGPTCYVGAAASNLAPSPMHILSGSVGGTIDLRFELATPGASMTGTVLGANGDPVRGALVVVGDSDRIASVLPDGTRGVPPEPMHVWTDENGLFVAGPVTPGQVTVAVVREGLARWSRTISVAANTVVDVLVHLQRGAVVEGVVRDEHGQPVKGARIEIIGAAMSSNGYSDVAGRYRIEGAPCDACIAEAHSTHGEEHRVEAMLQLVDGATTVWNPVLEVGLELRGRVIDHQGSAAVGLSVSGCYYRNDRGDWRPYDKTDADGRFCLRGCRANTPFFVTVCRDLFPLLQRADVQAAPGELLLQLPPPTQAWIRGLVVADNGAALPNVLVTCLGDEWVVRVANDAATGTFLLGPIPPGDVTLMLRDSHRAPSFLPVPDLKDGETRDLGKFQLVSGGRLQLTLAGDPAREMDQTFEIWSSDGRYLDSVKLVESRGNSTFLPPGEHVLRIEGDGIVNDLVPIRIHDGSDTQLEVVVRAGTKVSFRFPIPVGLPPVDRVELTVTHTMTNRVVVQRTVPCGDSGVTFGAVLSPGDYQVTASCRGLAGGDLGGSDRVSVGSTDEVIDVPLRRQR